MTTQELIDQIRKKKSFLCIGLDVDMQKIPPHLLKTADPIFEFNKAIIEATHHLCVAYKPNTAFYEAYGLKGWKSLEKTIHYLNQKYPENCKVKVYDSLALENTVKLFKNTIEYCNSIYDCSKNSDCLIIMNADKEFKKITHKNISNMHKKFIIDTRRILKISNVEYIALGKNSDNY